MVFVWGDDHAPGFAADESGETGVGEFCLVFVGGSEGGDLVGDLGNPGTGVGKRAGDGDELFDEQGVDGDVGVAAFDVDGEVEQVLVHGVDVGGEGYEVSHR